MKAAIIAIFTAALCLAGAAAEAKGKAANSSAFKGGKTATGHSFPSKAPKAGKKAR
jgi:hypothetical protein